MENLTNREIISNLTLEEKASLLCGKNFWFTQNIDRLSIPSIMLADGSHGLRKPKSKPSLFNTNNLMSSTCFPTPCCIANSWDTGLLEDMGICLGKEASSENVGVLLGPALNIKRNPLCGRNFEYFSEDPYLTGKLASSMIRGIQSEGISACPKHFAVNSQERFKMIINQIVDIRALHEIYLEGFRYAIQEGQAKTIMTSYNKINGVYSNENEYLLKKVLRDLWGFDGLVISDWCGTNNRIEAIKNSSSFEIPSSKSFTSAEIVTAVQSGLLKEAVLDDRVDEILKVVRNVSPVLNKGANFTYEEHYRKAVELAEKSFVLLKNEDNILPLKNKKQKIAVIGDFAKNQRMQGIGSSSVKAITKNNFIDIFEKEDYNFIGYEAGFKRFGKSNDDLKSKARTLAKNADLVLLFLGLDENAETENTDREHMSLNENQLEIFDEIYKYNKNIVVVLSGGSPVEMPFVDKCKAILHTFLSGEGGADATCNILTGKTNPSGKLAESYPLKYSDTVLSKFFGNKKPVSEYKESIFIGYRFYDITNKKLLFPFGYGLSYTTFEYLGIAVNGNTVKVLVSNTGNYDGEEIVQLYVKAVDSNILRVKKELKSFTKSFIKKGETKEVVLTLDDNAFKHFDVDSNSFVKEKCNFEILVGSSSKDIKLREMVFMDDDAKTLSPPHSKENLKSYYNYDILNVTKSEFELLINNVQYSENWTLGPLGYNDILLQARDKSKLGKYICKFLEYKYNSHKEKGNTFKANRYLLLSELPFRSFVHLSSGKITYDMLDGILLMINGSFTKGLKHFLKASINKNK